MSNRLNRLYRCAWPNGSVSVVLARDKDEAVFLLDEWGSAEPEWLTVLDTFMVDFEPDRERAKIEPPEDDDSDDHDVFHTFLLSEDTRDVMDFPDRVELAAIREKRASKLAAERVQKNLRDPKLS